MTRTTLALAVVTLALGLTACDDTPTSPSPGGNQIPNPVFTAQLLPGNEVPPVTNADAGASGSATITFNVSRDANGNIIAGSADFTSTLTGFPPGTSITGAHIHPGVAGTNGGVLVSTGLAPGELTLPAGSGTLNKTGIAVGVDTINAIIASPAAYYFNVHTTTTPSGAVRGQLVRAN